MKILVTGGAGFIGSHIADRFIKLGHHVVILDNLSSGKMENVNPEATFVEGDITDREMLTRLFNEHQFDVVNHHAAQIDVRISVDDPRHDAQLNIIPTISLLQESVHRGVKKFMFASSGGAIYGEQEYFPADEKHPTVPRSPYGVSKLAGEKYIQYFHSEYGIEYCLLRYANVYGPRQNPHGEAGVVAIFSNLLVQGKGVKINGDGKQTRDYVFVEDVVNANEAGLRYEDSICFNIGTGKETDVNQLYNHLSAVAGSQIAPEHVPGQAGEQRRSAISFTYAQEALGWKPATQLQAGLAKTYRSFSS